MTTDLITLSPAQHTALLPSLVALHCACITCDNMLAHFLPPLDPAFMEKWWLDSISDPLNTTFVTLSAPLPVDISPSTPASSLPTVTGVVQIRAPFSESEPFKCEVYKLMVSPDARRQGIAKKLMQRLEEEAVKKDRLLIILDTEVGSPAESVYPRLGYTRVGVIPGYGISPKDGTLSDEVWFYKDLRKVKRLGA
ncbi:MAG: hypothetical protein MMC23_001381 [Stictis urceolatum]|nr:hypothetical protein [Stictis urceolata]